jgi:hypothetical protein
MSSWQDRQYQGDVEGGPSFPFVQWIHRPNQVGQEAGGFFQPAAQADLLGARIPGVAAAFEPNGGEPEDGVYASSLQVAVLKVRKLYVVGRGKDAQVVREWQDGAHSKVQAACLVAVDGRAVGPAVLTVKSTTAKEFWAALRAHRDAVQKATGGEAPAYAFWMTLRAGRVGQIAGSTITTLERADGAFDPDGAFVGDDALDGVDWEQLRAWKAAWNGGGNGSRPAATPQASEEPEPASGEQMAQIRALLEALGYEGFERQNGVLAEQGYDVITMAAPQADELIGRLQAAVSKK